MHTGAWTEQARDCVLGKAEAGPVLLILSYSRELMGRRDSQGESGRGSEGRAFVSCSDVHVVRELLLLRPASR